MDLVAIIIMYCSLDPWIGREEYAGLLGKSKSEGNVLFLSSSIFNHKHMLRFFFAFCNFVYPFFYIGFV